MTKSGRFSSPAKADQFRKRVLVPRFDPKLRRTAHAQSGVFRERLVKPDVAFFADDRFQFLRNHEIGGQDRQLLVNVAGAEAQHEIAGVEHVADIAMHPFETRLITHAAMTVSHDFVGNRLAADARNRRFARRINVGHNHAIGVVEGAAKFTCTALWCANNDAVETWSAPVCGAVDLAVFSVARISVG